MPAAVALVVENADMVDAYVATLQRAGLRTGRSTVQAARSFCAKVQRAGGWTGLSRARQIDAVAKARAFSSWLMVTCQLTVSADVLGRLDLRLGNAGRNYCPTRTPGSSPPASASGSALQTWRCSGTRSPRSPPSPASRPMKFPPPSSSRRAPRSSTPTSHVGYRSQAATWPRSSTGSSSRCSTLVGSTAIDGRRRDDRCRSPGGPSSLPPSPTTPAVTSPRSS